MVLVSCSTTAPPDVVVSKNASAKDLYIVDCLLPGQVRQLGNTTYMTPRRPVRTTTADCRVRGGEYVAYDRADYKTALKIWLPAAEAGEAEAQNTVGEIFEQGLGTDPNYTIAAMWYSRAAKQGHKGGQFNLATLYETGRGVPADKIMALNLYRQAWGVSDDELSYRSEGEKALLEQAEVNASLKQEVATVQAELVVARTQVVVEKKRGQKVVKDLKQVKAELKSAQKTPEQAESISSDGRNFGRFYALMIGNDNYEHLNDLMTPISDVARIGAELKNRYSFQVKVLNNGDDASVLKALNEMHEVLEEEDNLLIYYAGHGSSRQTAAYNAGYWLPVNAQLPPNDTYWVPTEQVSGHLARLKAKRIIVFADSAFAGLLADNPAFLLVSDPAQLRSEAYINLRFPNRSRLLFTSGKDQPLPRTGVSNTSVFADALLATLSSNQEILTAPALFLSVMQALETRQPDLSPEFKAIKRAGDQVGDFFFVAK